MKRLFLTLALLFTAAPLVSACPLCKESIPEANDGASEDGNAEGRSEGYNYSIYFMLAVPATLCSVLGLVVYRQCRRIDGANPS